MKKSLAKDKVLQALREKILSGEYPSDTPLREVEIANHFGVSRTPVREALRELESEGFVHIIPNVGAFVGSVSWDDASEIFAIRIVLEAFAAQLTASRLSEEQLAQLETLLQRQREFAVSRDVQAYTQADEKFHALLNEACGNRHLVKLIEMLNDKTKLSNLRNRTFHRETGLETSLREHEAIISALKARDVHRVGRLLYLHGRRFYDEVVRSTLPEASFLASNNREDIR